MEKGKATADGVPAHAVKMLDELEAAIRERLPRVMDFVRPGFDEPDIAAGALTRRAPFELRPRGGAPEVDRDHETHEKHEDTRSRKRGVLLRVVRGLRAFVVALVRGSGKHALEVSSDGSDGASAGAANVDHRRQG
jgi:hypothetical protein